jgi:hypothetical protein
MVSSSSRKRSNPFVITKAVDLTDEEIQTLWVDVVTETNAVAELARPASPMPTYILGGKGSGKTHLMRYHAFELQTLRHTQAGLSAREGVRRDGYVGMYMRCSGLNAGRFTGKRQSDSLWYEVFAYYVELWLAQTLLRILRVMNIGVPEGDEQALCNDIAELFDVRLQIAPRTLAEISSYLAELQKDLDFRVNNCVVSGKLEPQIVVTRGNLIFGIPKLIVERYPFLREVMFVYAIDEFENLTMEQQKFINTLVRERELPTTLRIGARLYGIKTWATGSADEENLLNSEYELLPLDERFRAHKSKYREFSQALIRKRLAAAFETGVAPDGDGTGMQLGKIFEIGEDSWDSSELRHFVPSQPELRPHFQALRTKLKSEEAIGVRSRSDIEVIIQHSSAPDFPLLEKLNLLLLYQDWSNGKNLIKASREIQLMCAKFLEGARKGARYASVLEHFKGDLLAQLLRENGKRQDYFGLESFIAMSAGLPRALLTILKYVFDWSAFNGEDPFITRRVSRDAQHRGVKDASDWFYENMRKAGNDGILIQTAIDRLSSVFRINRFADKPVECSLIAFSIDEHSVGTEALRVLKMAESRSFLIRIPGGQRDKNSERVTMKFQLNNMLCPRWDLPLGRRGAVPLKAQELDAIFDISKKNEFQELLADWTDRTNAPSFGKRRYATPKSRQDSLFHD